MVQNWEASAKLARKICFTVAHSIRESFARANSAVVAMGLTSKAVKLTIMAILQTQAASTPSSSMAATSVAAAFVSVIASKVQTLLLFYIHLCRL